MDCRKIQTGPEIQDVDALTVDECIDLARRGVCVEWSNRDYAPRKPGPPRALTREDVAFTLELMSEGVTLASIACWVFGITTKSMKLRLKTWGVAL